MDPAVLIMIMHFDVRVRRNALGSAFSSSDASASVSQQAILDGALLLSSPLFPASNVAGAHVESKSGIQEYGSFLSKHSITVPCRERVRFEKRANYFVWMKSTTNAYTRESAGAFVSNHQASSVLYTCVYQAS